MTEVEFRSDFPVELVDSMGSDAAFVQAAKISTLRDRENDEENERTWGGSLRPEVLVDNRRFLSFLMKNRHHSPFEHGALTFRIEAPIVVAREFFRHRIASYNEMSGRYTEMRPVFYVPDTAVRPLAQVGKPGAYTYSMEENSELEFSTVSIFQTAAGEAWRKYQVLLEDGVAKEVARMVLPVNIYTQWYVTMNPRALMNFLSLRTPTVEGVSSVPSFPMWEIAQVAARMEDFFKSSFPVTWDVWNANGREGA